MLRKASYFVNVPWNIQLKIVKLGPKSTVFFVRGPLGVIRIAATTHARFILRIQGGSQDRWYLH
jgi:hypothetical protein